MRDLALLGGGIVTTWGFDPENMPDPDDETWLDELREAGLNDEQVEQAQAQARFLRNLTPEQRAAQEQQMGDIEMATSLEPRIVASVDLIAIDALAEERDYNRRLSAETLAVLDPEGNHVLSPILIHRHAQGEEAEPHMRCRALLKLQGREPDDPVDATVDVAMEQFLRLHPVSAARRILGLPPSEDDTERIISDFWRMIDQGEIEPGEPRLRVLT